MYQSLNNTGFFLINSIFDLYLMILCVRLILAYSKANYFNPITRFIIVLTQPVIAPVRQYIPNYKRLETSTLLFMLALSILKIAIISYLFSNIPSVQILIIAGFLECVKLILNTLFYSILIAAILSFFSPQETPLTQILSQITSPILRPFQRLIPPVSGFDLSPIPVLLLLQILIRLI
ncbi:YggT family protein [Gammaproteobacteria bacterium]|nr:YggT family protein [Gammaproteobacteria bacterium]